MRIVDKPFVEWMHATFGCLVASFGGCRGPLTFHHVKACPGAGKDDRRGLMLCAAHHLHGWGPQAIEHGKAAFEENFALDIEVEVRRNQVAYLESGHRFKVPLAEAA